MTREIINNQVILTADPGKVMSNGDAIGIKVVIGKNDSESNWHEIDMPEDTNN